MNEPTATGDAATDERPPVPVTVTIAFWALLVIYAVGTIASAIDRVREPADDLAGVGIGARVFSVVILLAFAAIPIGLVVLARRGFGWARVVLLVLWAAGAIVGIAGAAIAGTIGLLTVLSPIVTGAAIALLWLPPSTRYFRDASAARLRHSSVDPSPVS